MSSSNYARGSAFERKVRQELRDCDGVVHIIRSAGSKGAVDLAVFLDGIVLWIQCKTFGVPTYNERRSLARLAERAGTIAVVAWRGDGGIKYGILDETGAFKRYGIDVAELFY